MTKFIALYEIALQKYIAQVERTHHTQMSALNHRIYTFGLFSYFRHSCEEYDELKTLRAQLQADLSDEQINAKLAIIRHFEDKKHRWNNHSFNNYLLDEIKQSVTDIEWQESWNRFDTQPIIYKKGLLFRGTGAKPAHVFKSGMVESNDSRSIDDYIKDMNGAIGVSTSKLFSVAHGYALPNIDPRKEWVDFWHESYIYVLDYQGTRGIDLELTFRARGRTIAAYFSGLATGKAEVNVIGSIEPEHVVGAFYVNREGAIRWQVNPGFSEERARALLPTIQASVPQAFANEIEKGVARQHRLS